MDATVETLKKAFVDGLGIPADTDFDNLSYRGVEQWDSVAHLQLVMEIENAFGVMLPTDDVLDLSSFVKAQEILKKHGVELTA